MKNDKKALVLFLGVILFTLIFSFGLNIVEARVSPSQILEIKNNLLELRADIKNGEVGLVESLTEEDNLVTNSVRYCNTAGGTMSLSQFRSAKNDGEIYADVDSSGSATITNNTNCSFPVSLVSYKMYDQTLIHQVYFDGVTGTALPNSVLTLTVDLPPCMAQIDAYYGQIQTSVNTLDTGKLISWNYYQNGGNGWEGASGNFCSDPHTDDDLSGSCSVTPNHLTNNGYLNWSASATGGDGDYDFSWSGTDSLNGNASFVSKYYSTTGTKTGTVTITSDGQSITRTCSAVVSTTYNNDLNVSCSVSRSSVRVDQNVTWSANATGGDGDYDYDWDGTENLSGSNRTLTWSYDYTGTKRATVTVTSDGQTVSASCTTRVTSGGSSDDDLSVSCYASPSTTQVGNRIRWYVEVDGGDGDYDYDWTGTNGLNSSSKSPYMTYSTVGRKSARVTVTDGDGNEDSDTCYANVNSVLAYSETYQPLQTEGIYLSQVPYTGLADNSKLAFFIGILALFSAWIAYIVVSYKKNSGVIDPR